MPARPKLTPSSRTLSDFEPSPQFKKMSSNKFKKRLREAEKNMSRLDAALINLERYPESVEALTLAINVMVGDKLDNETIQSKLDKVTMGAPRKLLNQVAKAHDISNDSMSTISALFVALSVAITTSVSQTYISSIVMRIAYYLSDLAAKWTSMQLVNFITSTVSAIPGLVWHNPYISALLIILTSGILLRNNIFLKSFASSTAQTARAATAKLSDEEQKKMGTEASNKLIHYLKKNANRKTLIPLFTGLKDKNTLTTIMTDLKRDPRDFLDKLAKGAYHSPRYSSTILNSDNQKMFIDFLKDIFKVIKYSYSGIKNASTNVSMMIIQLTRARDMLRDGSQPSAAPASMRTSSPSSSSSSSSSGGGTASRRRKSSRKQRKTIRKKVSKSMKRTFKKTRRQRR